MPRKQKRRLALGKDYVVEDGHTVLTRDYLLTLGQCCGKQCPHCPYPPEPPVPDRGALIANGPQVAAEPRP